MRRRRRSPPNTQSDRVIEVDIPATSDFALLRQYARRIEMIWRRESFGEVNVAANLHLRSIETFVGVFSA